MRIQHPSLLNLSGIEHGFFTRSGGTSSDTYHSLNCGYGSDDDQDKVRQNRALVAKTMGVDEGRLVTAYQVHSADAMAIDAPFPKDNTPKVDALVTTSERLAVAILTADCGPILFADPIHRVVAAAHAGWRGAFGGVIEETIRKMCELGAEASKITAILGPTISCKNYEVDQGFLNRFTETRKEWERFFSPGQREGHHQFDLPAFIMMRLEHSGIGTAVNLDLCTYEEEDRFFSYRRSTHRKEPDYGRQISTIALV
ncbi:peptidoglycan editing factor PgeF [uncultured Cohaesibacter sp.]|uniref:peptidoglycan editing factor PgeF n=1 Tax=uncultured Cohaesibacter sp. TaxID=1002546 RepID=UPI0029302C85|nr:peptidoglycan editing factor PgeF [uncultured Cohaesibacter sp.]